MYSAMKLLNRLRVLGFGLVLFFGATPGTVGASSPVTSCPQGELRLDAPGGSMEGVPVYSQIGGTCYAYAAANAIDAWRSQGRGPLAPDERLNPFELALGNGQLEYGQLRLKSTVAGGQFCTVVNYARRAGGCTQGVFPLVNDEGESLGPIVRQISQAHGKFKKLNCREKRGDPGEAILDSIEASLRDFGIPDERIPGRDVLRDALSKTRQEYQRRVLSEPWCEGVRTQVEIPRSCHQELSAFESPSRILSKIESRLTDITSQPVGIGYCSAVLKKGLNYEGFSHRFFDFDFPDTEECGGHVSLVTGKRISPETGRLEFLVHNSWGKGCKRYAPEWECLLGKIWVDAEALARNTYGLMWL